MELTKNNLQNFWQYRLAKVVWIFVILGIAICGISEIFDDRFDNKPRKYERIIINGQIYEHKFSPFNSFNISLAILEIFILLGSLALATILLQKILFYIIFNEPFFGKNKNFDSKNQNQNKNQNEEKTETLELSKWEIIKNNP